MGFFSGRLCPPSLRTGTQTAGQNSVMKPLIWGGTSGWTEVSSGPANGNQIPDSWGLAQNTQLPGLGCH